MGVDDYMNKEVTGIQAAKNPAEQAYIAASINIDMLPDPAATVARRCGLLDWFDLDVVKSLVDDVDLPNAEEIFNQIISLPFVEQVDGRYQFHALSAEGWQSHYNEHDPNFVKEIFALAFGAYIDKNINDYEHTQAKIQAVFALIIGQRYNKAYGMIQEFLEDDTIPLSCVANFFARLEQLEKRWRWVTLPPYAVDFYRYIGIHHSSHSGDYDLAIAAYDKAIGIDPNDEWAYRWKGNSYRSLNKYELAIENYSRAIELDPSNPLVWMSRMGCYNLLHEYDKANHDEQVAREIYDRQYSEKQKR